jgi:hypothetical protein
MSPYEDDLSVLQMCTFPQYLVFPAKTKCIDIKTNAML